MSFSQQTVHKIAAQRLAKEQAERRAAEEQEERATAAAVAALAEATRLSRIRQAQEREEARLRAERALAEERVREEAAALEAAVEAELERLRNRTEVEVLRDEVAELKKLVESSKKPSYTVAIQSPRYGDDRWIGYLKGKPCDWSWVDPTPGTEKELLITYRDYTTGRGVEHQVKFLERENLHIEAINMEIVRAIWRGKVFGGRAEGFGPRSVPLSCDNPYKKCYNPACPLGEIDVTDSLQQQIVICSWH